MHLTHLYLLISHRILHTDCYLAATGLPDPQEDHAVLMTKFAIGCMESMRLTSAKLASLYGDETAKLTCRTGIHSGTSKMYSTRPMLLC